MAISLHTERAVPVERRSGESILVEAQSGVARKVESRVNETLSALSEIAQAKIRFGMNVGLTLLGLAAYQHNQSLPLEYVLASFAGCFAAALGLYMWAKLLGVVLTHPGWRVGQRTASIIADNIGISWILYFGGETLAGAFGVYLWITIGYGMRYGLTYLWGNLFASFICFLWITMYSDFWRANPSLSIGLGIALLIVPTYAAFLIKRLRAALNESQLAYAAKSDFVAKMSHELRTPLHGIISIADLLSRTEATEQQKEMFRIITVSSNTLLDLINRILDISKFEDGTFAIQREPMNLHTVVTDTLSILWPQASEKGLRVDFHIDSDINPWLIGSPRQLQEVLINLGGNAIKFTSEGRIYLKVEQISASNHTCSLRFSVEDTGPGMAQEQLEKVFNPFYQVDGSVTRKHGGTGLGTSIAKELVRLMGGTINVESALGVGTTFTVDLPFDIDSGTVAARTANNIDVAVIATPQTFNEFVKVAAPLGVRGLHVTKDRLDVLQNNGSIAAIMLDIQYASIPPAEINRFLPPRLRDSLLPVFAFGIATDQPQAIANSYSSFIKVPFATQPLERLVDVARALREDYATQVTAEPSRRKLRILVAEDNLTNQTIASLALKEGGYDCTIVGDGEAALDELAEHDDYAVALIDMHMPGMDGVEVVRLYNFANPDSTTRTPIIMLTADNRPEVIADAEFAGVSRFLTKPVKPSLMLEIVNKVIAEQGRFSIESPKETVRPMKLDEASTDSRLLDDTTVHELLGYMEGNERAAFFAEFTEDAFRYAESVTNHVADEQLKKLRDDMHALCGAARTVGALKLAASARRVEYAPRVEIEKNKTRIKQELVSLIEESDRALRKIAGLG